VEFFEKKVRPVLAANCFQCHSTQVKKVKGGLLLDSRPGVLRGGDNGPAVVPGQPDKSRLIEAVRYENVEIQMPPKGKLPNSAIADLVAWVKMGAPWPKEDESKAALYDEFNMEKRRREHWAWQPVRPRTPPVGRDAA